MTEKRSTFLGPHASSVPSNPQNLEDNGSVLKHFTVIPTTSTFASISPTISKKISVPNSAISANSAPQPRPVNMAPNFAPGRPRRFYLGGYRPGPSSRRRCNSAGEQRTDASLANTMVSPIPWFNRFALGLALKLYPYCQRMNRATGRVSLWRKSDDRFLCTPEVHSTLGSPALDTSKEVTPDVAAVVAENHSIS